jgi:hypothetical protein
MKKFVKGVLLILWSAVIVAGCEPMAEKSESQYLEVIGEHDETTPDVGYRLNLSYNGPMQLREKFQMWADSVQKIFPGMVKTNDNIYINYIPEQMGKRIRPEMYQVGVTYMLSVSDSATYTRMANDLLKRNIPFSLNMMGTFIEPEKRLAMQKAMLGKALENAKAELDFLKGDPDKTYEIVSIEEMDNIQPYGPDYYDFNRRMVARLKVRARLIN